MLAESSDYFKDSDSAANQVDAKDTYESEEPEVSQKDQEKETMKVTSEGAKNKVKSIKERYPELFK
jgi:hypothetical protein